MRKQIRRWALVLALFMMLTTLPVYASDATTPKTSEEIDLYRREGSETIVGTPFPIESRTGIITKDSVLVYENEDGVRETFKAVESQTDPTYYYFSVDPSMAGTWTAILFDDTPISISSLNSVSYSSIEEFERIAAQQIREDGVQSKYDTVIRIQGKDRYQTALNIVKEGWTYSDFAVIASGENYADALFAGPLASEVKAPLLLTKREELPDGLINMLKELKVVSVYLVGGEQSVSPAVMKELQDQGFAVVRVAGRNRIETAGLVSRRIAGLRGIQILGDVPSFIVSETGFADALSAGPYVHFYSKVKTLGRFRPGHGKIYDMPIGGLSSVPAIENEKRIAGADRYQTAVELAKSFQSELGKEIQTLVIVDGSRFPDALSAGPLATRYNGTILLTQPDTLNKHTADFIKTHKVENVFIVGGTDSVSEAVAMEIQNLME